MNPWAPNDANADSDSALQAAPYRVALGGMKEFVTRNRLHEQHALCVDTSAYSSVQLTTKIETLIELKTTSFQRVRELEQMEAQVATGDILLPRQLEAKVETVRALRSDLEELLAMKSVMLRTLQKNIASEFLDIEMQHQRTFIDLFLKLSDELPRYASSLVAGNSNSSAASSTSSGFGNSSSARMARDFRQRHKDYEQAVAQCKATIAKFHLLRDDMARVRAAYTHLEQSARSA